MAIKKYSKISDDAIMFRYFYTCPSCNATHTSLKDDGEVKCPKCDTIMVLSGSTTADE